MHLTALVQHCILHEGLHVNLQETRSIHDFMTIPKLNLLLILLIFTFFLYIYNIKFIFNLGIKTVLYLKYDCINGLVRV